MCTRLVLSAMAPEHAPLAAALIGGLSAGREGLEGGASSQQPAPRSVRVVVPLATLCDADGGGQVASAQGSAGARAAGSRLFSPVMSIRLRDRGVHAAREYGSDASGDVSGSAADTPSARHDSCDQSASENSGSALVPGFTIAAARVTDDFIHGEILEQVSGVSGVSAAGAAAERRRSTGSFPLSSISMDGSAQEPLEVGGAAACSSHQLVGVATVSDRTVSARSKAALQCRGATEGGAAPVCATEGSSAMRGRTRGSQDGELLGGPFGKAAGVRCEPHSETAVDGGRRGYSQDSTGADGPQPRLVAAEPGVAEGSAGGTGDSVSGVDGGDEAFGSESVGPGSVGGTASKQGAVSVMTDSGRVVLGVSGELECSGKILAHRLDSEDGVVSAGVLFVCGCTPDGVAPRGSGLPAPPICMYPGKVGYDFRLPIEWLRFWEASCGWVLMAANLSSRAVCECAVQVTVRQRLRKRLLTRWSAKSSLPWPLCALPGVVAMRVWHGRPHVLMQPPRGVAARMRCVESSRLEGSTPGGPQRRRSWWRHPPRGRYRVTMGMGRVARASWQG